MLVKLSKCEKINVLNDLEDTVMKNSFCGSYIDLMDYITDESLDSLAEWYADTRDFTLKADTCFGVYSYKYDFDFNHDYNLQAFYDGLIEYVLNKQ